MTHEFKMEGRVNRREKLLQGSEGDDNKPPEDRGMHDSSGTALQNGPLKQNIFNESPEALKKPVERRTLAFEGFHHLVKDKKTIPSERRCCEKQRNKDKGLPGHVCSLIFLNS